jgi:hypothetical protein
VTLAAEAIEVDIGGGFGFPLVGGGAANPRKKITSIVGA